MKKPGLDILLAINKPKAMKGGPGASPLPPKPEAEESPVEEAAEYDVAACVKRIEANQKKILEALGLEAEGEEAEDLADEAEGE